MALTTVRPQGMGFNTGRRNLIINGAMQVAQRGTSSTTNGYGSVDRFQTLYGGGTITHSQETLTSDSPYNNGFRNFLRLTVTSAGSNSASDYCYISHRIEAQNVANSGWQYTSSNSFVSIQFWVRTSVAGTYYTSLQSNDGTARAFVFPVVLSANTWTKVTKAIPGDSSTLEFANDTGIGLNIQIRPYVGTNYSDSGVNTNSWYSRSGSTQTPDYTQNWQSTGSATFDLTGVQLELGENASDFEHRSFGEELSLCQRYFYREVDDDGSMFSWVGFADSSTAAYLQHPHPVEMRAEPSMSTTGTAGDYSLRIGANTVGCSNVPLLSSSTKRVGHVQWRVSSGLTTGQAVVGKHDDTDKYIDWSAEL
jgi:hypothetical protein